MPNESCRFPPLPDFASWSAASDGIRITALDVGPMWILMGPSGAEITPTPIAWPEIADGAPYAVRISPWKTVVIGDQPLEHWGIAVDASALWRVFEMSGSGVWDIVGQGGEIALDIPSPSSARLFTGRGCLLYRYGACDSLRLHVPRAMSVEMALWLEIAVGRVSGIAAPPS